MNRLPLASIFAVTLAALLLGPTLAHADDITYTFDQSLSGNGGSFTVTGTVTTDGALGALAASDITNVDLSFSETTYTTASAALNGLDFYTGGLSATADGLFFDFNSNLSAIFHGHGDLDFAPGIEVVYGLGIDSVQVALSGNLEIATAIPAVTPEPSSFLLLGTGALGLVSVARRRLTA